MSKKLLIGTILSILTLLFFPSQSSAQVVINEFLPAPSSGNPEWVEFYNSASSSADLSDYYFDDDDSFNSDSGSSQLVAISGILPTLSTCYWELSSYLNNNGDKPTLFNTGGTTIDSYTYTSTQSDKSYSRDPDGGSWQQNVTSTKSSTSCLDLTPSPTPTSTPTPTPSPTSTPTPTPSPTTTPTPTPTKTPTATPTKSPSPTPSEEANEETVSTSSPTPGATVLGKSTEKKWSILPYLLIGAGVLCLGAAGYFLYNRKKSEEV